MSEMILRLVGTCPVAAATPANKDYREIVDAVAKWADEDGWEAVLVYTDHRQVDPWLISQFIIERTKRLCPLVAVQPIYMHPFALAKNVLSLAFLYKRQVYLNMVAGGFPRDLAALCDDTPHDKRYERIVEYASIVRHLLGKKSPLTHVGEFYRTKDLQLISTLPENLFPVFMMSGSSAAGLAAAEKINARAIQYLRPANEYKESTFTPQLHHGTRLGVIVREKTEEAWKIANKRFPPTATGAALKQYAVSVSDSVWIKELNKAVQVQAGHPYSLAPYQNGYTSCPFLVGSFDDVAGEIVSYAKMGFRTFLLEQPEDAEDSKRITAVFRLASQRMESAART